MIEPKTLEQAALQADLIERFGFVTFTRAWHMSGLRNCLQALALDKLSEMERAEAYAAASMHMAKLHASFITREQSEQLTECAKRIDAAIDTWTLDAIEQRDGLPPADSSLHTTR